MLLLCDVLVKIVLYFYQGFVNLASNLNLLILFNFTTMPASATVMPDTFFYFAFGSNLLTERILINNPSATFVEVARLDVSTQQTTIIEL
jgi:hypothetical protein